MPSNDRDDVVNDELDDDLDEDDTDSAEDDEHEDGDETDKTKSAASARTARRKLSKERARYRALEAEVAALKAKVGTGKGRTASSTTEADHQAAIAAARDEARAEVMGTLGAKLIASRAAALLSERGVRGNPLRISRLLELDSVTIDPATGRVDDEAIVDAIDDLEDDDPSLFRASRASTGTRRGTRDDDAGDRDDTRRTSGRRAKKAAPASDTGRSSSNGDVGSSDLDAFARGVLRETGSALGITKPGPGRPRR